MFSRTLLCMVSILSCTLMHARTFNNAGEYIRHVAAGSDLTAEEINDIIKASQERHSKQECGTARETLVHWLREKKGDHQALQAAQLLDRSTIEQTPRGILQQVLAKPAVGQNQAIEHKSYIADPTGNTFQTDGICTKCHRWYGTQIHAPLNKELTKIGNNYYFKTCGHLICKYCATQIHKAGNSNTQALKCPNCSEELSHSLLTELITHYCFNCHFTNN